MARKRNNPYNKWMEIQPKSPPGRKNRKLLAHLSTLRRLHEQGYSVRQIEGFFKEAGVDVGLASVQREIKKLANSKPIQSPIAPESRQPAASEIPESPITPPGPGPSVTNITTPKPPTADEFFASYVDNPLLRRRRESSS